MTQGAERSANGAAEGGTDTVPGSAGDAALTPQHSADLADGVALDLEISAAEEEAADTGQQEGHAQMRELRERFADPEGNFPWAQLRELANHLELFNLSDADLRRAREAVCTDASSTSCSGGTFDALVRELKELGEVRFMADAARAARRAAHSKEMLIKMAEASRAFSPECTLRWAADLGVIAIAGYYAVVIPLRLVGHQWTAAYAIVEVFLSVLLIGEIALNFRCSYVHQGLLVDSLRRIAVHYLRGWFLVDLLSSIPLDLIVRSATGPSPAALVMAHLRLLRLLRIPGLLQLRAIGTVGEMQVWFYVTVVPTLRLLFWSVMGVHWGTLLWVYTFEGTSDVTPSEYLSGLYYVTETLTSVGYGDLTVSTDGQRALCIFMFIAGVLANGLLISQITQLFMQADASEDRTLVLQRTLAIMNQHQIPRDMRQEVLSYQYHQLNHNTAGSYQSVFMSLPAAMQTDLAMFVRIGVVQRVPIFQAAAPECQVALAHALTEIVVPPDEPVCEIDDVGHEMFFIVHGCAEVLNRQNHLLAVLRKGTFFGEIALLQQGVLRTATIRTVTYSALLMMNREEFDAIRSRFPTFSREMEAEARRRAEAQKKQPAALPPAAAAASSDRASEKSEDGSPVHNPLLPQTASDREKETAEARIQIALGEHRRSSTTGATTPPVVQREERSDKEPDGSMGETPPRVSRCHSETSGVSQILGDISPPRTVSHGAASEPCGHAPGGGVPRTLVRAVQRLTEEMAKLTGEVSEVREVVEGVAVKYGAVDPSGTTDPSGGEAVADSECYTASDDRTSEAQRQGSTAGQRHGWHAAQKKVLRFASPPCDTLAGIASRLATPVQHSDFDESRKMSRFNAACFQPSARSVFH